MAYTETTTKGWGERLGSSFKGIITGFVLIAIGTGLLWWNEERTFKTAGAIGEAQMLTEDVQDISKVDPSLDGHVIHATGRADTKDTLRDPVFGVQVTAIRLDRDVEFYQWHEESHSEKRKKLGGGEETVTTYTYEMGWSSGPIDSGSFHDPDYRGRNVTLATLNDETQWAKNVTFGAYTLPDSLKHSIGGATALAVENVDMDSVLGILTVPEEYKNKYLKTTGTNGNFGMGMGIGSLNVNPLTSFIHVAGGTVYIGADPASPKIGDVRVTFKQVPPADVSIIAKVLKNTFEAYKASNGYDFIQLDMGTASMEKMFEGAKSSNNIMAWVLRVVGFLVVVAGLRAVFGPLSVIADVIPLLGDIVGAGVGLVAFLLGLAWSCIVIAIAWVRFRPLIAGCLIAAAVVIFGLVCIKGRKKAA